MSDRRNLLPADELGLLRAEIKRLKARETELRDQFREMGRVSPGAEYTVEVVEQRRRVFDRSLLPADILEDPRYWKEIVTQIVKVRLRDQESASEALIDDDDL
ncbi:MAG: hypothetical protein AAGI13_03380 [Pseudomonadota bacterium]